MSSVIHSGLPCCFCGHALMLTMSMAAATFDPIVTATLPSGAGCYGTSWITQAAVKSACGWSISSRAPSGTKRCEMQLPCSMQAMHEGDQAPILSLACRALAQSSARTQSISLPLDESILPKFFPSIHGSMDLTQVCCARISALGRLQARKWLCVRTSGPGSWQAQGQARCMSELQIESRQQDVLVITSWALTTKVACFPVCMCTPPWSAGATHYMLIQGQPVHD